MTIDALVEWLRRGERIDPTSNFGKAADALERLQRERDELKHDIERHVAIYAELAIERAAIIRQTREECALVVERVFNEWKKDDNLRDMLEEISASILALPEEKP